MPRKDAAADVKHHGASSGATITVAELAKHNGSDGSCWTAIDGEVYDVSGFMASHPGGDIIRLSAGRDSSTLIECYHPAGKMKSVISALSTRTKHVGRLEESAIVRNDHSFYLKVQQRVEAQLASAGVPRHWSDVLSIAEVIITVTLYCIATYYTSVHGSYLASAALGLLTARLGFIMHSGNHMATSDAGWGNVLAGYCMELAGSSHLVWYFEHQVAHHMDPNEVGKDNDCSIGSPHLRFHPDVPAGKSKVTKYQHILTFVAMSFGFLKWYVADFGNFWTGKVGSVNFHVSSSDWARLVFFKGWWFFTHVVVCCYYQGLAWALISPVIFMVIGAHYLENIFIVNHIQEELAHPEPTSHWAVKQVTATSNWSSGSVFWNWVSGGLNHQIEHHLFPSVSIYNYPLISATVRQTCAEFGLPYQNYKNFAHAWTAMASYLRDLGAEGAEVAKAKYDKVQESINVTPAVRKTQ